MRPTFRDAPRRSIVSVQQLATTKQTNARNAAEALEGLITTKEAAAILCLSVRTIQELAANKDLPVIKIGKAVRYDVADLRKFIERKKLKATGWKGGAK